MEQNYWRKCSVCKKELAFNKIYYTCSVSTCNKKRAPNQFCSVSCWDTHQGVIGHRDAGAEENLSPSTVGPDQSHSEERIPRRILVKTNPATGQVPTPHLTNEKIPKEVLVVVSKLKSYIKACSDMNTAADVMPMLSEIMRKESNRAIENARLAGRKTVMARDFID